VDGGANAWSDEAAEIAFLSEARARGEAAVPVPPEAAEEAGAGPLPQLEALVQRVPAEVRELLDDLFRAKFTSVRRVPRKALQD
jgi:hypothetical protein